MIHTKCIMLLKVLVHCDSSSASQSTNAIQKPWPRGFPITVTSMTRTTAAIALSRGLSVVEKQVAQVVIAAFIISHLCLSRLQIADLRRGCLVSRSPFFPGSTICMIGSNIENVSVWKKSFNQLRTEQGHVQCHSSVNTQSMFLLSDSSTCVHVRTCLPCHTSGHTHNHRKPLQSSIRISSPFEYPFYHFPPEPWSNFTSLPNHHTSPKLLFIQPPCVVK